MRSTRAGVQRIKNADENAISKLKQQSSNVAATGNTRTTRNLAVVGKNGQQRPALGEVTTKAVNRKVRTPFLYSFIRMDLFPDTSVAVRVSLVLWRA